LDHQASQQTGTEREITVLNIICTVGAIAFLAFAAFNALTSGDFLTTDNLFLTVICLLFALVFAVGPLSYLKDTGRLPMPFKKKALAESAAPGQLGTGAELSEAEAVHDDLVEQHHFAGTNKLFMSIWVWLLVLTGIEIFLGYKPMSLKLMLTILLGLSVIKAALIVAYFMHLKFERLSLILTVVPMLVICILLLFVFFPDSFRSIGLRYKFKEPPPIAVEKSEDQ
jgi:cytochrome c oxidase subunit 4